MSMWSHLHVVKIDAVLSPYSPHHHHFFWCWKLASVLVSYLIYEIYLVWQPSPKAGPWVTSLKSAEHSLNYLFHLCCFIIFVSWWQKLNYLPTDTSYLAHLFLILFGFVCAIYLERSFLQGLIFLLFFFSSKGSLGQVWKHFFIVTLEGKGGCYSYLINKDYECC